jgi:hypothetical protein
MVGEVFVLGWMVVWGASAFAADVVVPVQGSLVDAAGFPLQGVHAVEFRLYEASSGGSPSWADTFNVASHDGAFAALLGSGDPLSHATLGAQGHYLSVVLGGVESERVPVGTAARAALAYDASALGGVAASLYALDADLIWSNLAGRPTELTDGDAGQGMNLAQLSDITWGNVGGRPADLVDGDAGQGLTYGSGLALSGTQLQVNLADLYAALDARYPRLTNGRIDVAALPAGASSAQAEVDTNRTTCVIGDRGKLYYNLADGLLYVCDGSQWKRSAPRPGTLQWSVANISFGTVTNTPSQAAVTLTNVGDVPVSGLAVSVPAGVTQVSTTCATSLGANAGCTVTLAVRPGAAASSIAANLSATATSVPTAFIPVTGASIGGTSCKGIKDAWSGASDGTYWLDPDGAGTTHAGFATYCDQTYDGGGWTLVQRSFYTSQDQRLTTALNVEDLATISANTRTSKVSDAVWNALAPTEHWSMCGLYQTMYRRAPATTWASNIGQTGTCSYTTGTYNGVRRSPSDGWSAPTLYAGACGGSQLSGNWGVLSGIQVADGAHFGCYAGCAGPACGTAPSAYAQYNTGSWGSSGLMFVR